MSRLSVLGGESRSRTLLGGARRSRKQMAVWLSIAVATCFLVLFLQITGVVISVILAVIAGVAFLDDGSGGSPLRRWEDKRRWKERVRRGYVNFSPVAFRPDDMVPKIRGSRSDRAKNEREWNSYRDWPDGVDGLNWLERRPGRPAIAYHTPPGEAPYYTVVWSVDGAIQGLHGDGFVAEGQWRFGQLLAGWGASMRLVSGMQTVTRMLPADSALHEVWLQDQLDPTTPAHLQEDLGHLIDEVSQRSFVQRHFVVVRWDADSRLQALAGRRGQWPDGALDLMREQTVQVERRLIDAGFQKVRALSGPQLGAVLRHLQHPGWPIDRASDVSVDTCWLPSHDEWSWTEVTAGAPDPVRPDLFQDATTWYHRTALLPVAALEVRARDGLWMSPLLTRMDEQVVRTLSSHILLVPASEAKVTARRDVTLDHAEIARDERKGRVASDAPEVSMSAATRRYADLRDGTGHHGVTWLQYLTVSAPSLDELRDACSLIEAGADELGYSRVDWLDTLSSAAQATTWPVGRGLSTPKKSTATKAIKAVGKGSPKEAMST